MSLIDVRRPFLKGDQMDENRIHKLIGYLVLAFVAYQILTFVVPYLMYGVIGLVLIRVFQEYQKNRR